MDEENKSEEEKKGKKRKSSCGASSTARSSKSTRHGYQSAFKNILEQKYQYKEIDENGKEFTVIPCAVFGSQNAATQACHFFLVGKRTSKSMKAIFELMRFVANDGVTEITDIYSVDNGFLLRNDIHNSFDEHEWGIKCENVVFILFILYCSM